jgi:hypothetical protein
MRHPRPITARSTTACGSWCRYDHVTPPISRAVRDIERPSLLVYRRHHRLRYLSESPDHITAVEERARKQLADLGVPWDSPHPTEPTVPPPNPPPASCRQPPGPVASRSTSGSRCARC